MITMNNAAPADMSTMSITVTAAAEMTITTMVAPADIGMMSARG